MTSRSNPRELDSPEGSTKGCLTTGATIDGRYRLGARLGRDETRPIELYHAEQLSLGRRVLIKILRIGETADPKLGERFRREALLLARLDHPGVAHVIDFGLERGTPYLVREMIEGRSLEALLAEGKRFTPAEAVPLLVDLCAAIEHAHQAGVIHRDLKPSKVIISSDGRTRIADFGVAGLVQPERGRDPQATIFSALATDADYSAPEALLGEPIDRRADLYSLGVIAYRMISGRLPKAGPAPLREAARLPESAARFCSIVDRLLARSPGERCSSAGWVAHALQISARVLATFPDAAEGATVVAEEGLADEELPDGTEAAVLVADPNQTVAGRPPPAAAVKSASVEPRLASASRIDPAPIVEPRPASASRIEPEPASVERRRAPVVAGGGPRSLVLDDVSWARPAMRVQAERARRLVARLELPRRAREAGDRIARLSFRQTALVAAGAALLAVLAIALVASRPGPAPAPTPPTSAALAAEARSLVARGETGVAIERLEAVLVSGGKYGDPVLHAALAFAHARGGDAAPALQHFTLVVGKDASALRDVDIRLLVALLSRPRPEGDRAADLVTRLGERATFALKAASEDRAADRNLKKRAKAILRANAARAKLSSAANDR